ncbi:MAG: hypothetical protein MJE66_11135 [Proteobacteria bacterium]|nr:hypothetical protein [Pseudomonadota bacterium]
MPASMTYDYLKPFSSHWLVEPAWSTIAQRYFVDGGEAERFDKLVALREWDVEALCRLRVCGAPNRAELKPLDWRVHRIFTSSGSSPKNSCAIRLSPASSASTR